MSLYAYQGADIRNILKAKIENILESDTDQDMINRLVQLINLLKAISSTREGEERKDLNVLYVTVSSIYSFYYSYMTALNRRISQSVQNEENFKLFNEPRKKFLNAMNEVAEAFLINLKEVISTAGIKNSATELFENTYDSLVEDVLNKYTM